MKEYGTMTLVAIWVQQHRTLSELVAVSDSRISGGESWDSCPKIVPLPRPATAIAMSGDATVAYAFQLQAINACLLLDGNENGRMDIGYLARKLKDVYDNSRRNVGDLPVGQTAADIPELDVVLFGWSWRRLSYEAYSFRYVRNGILEMRMIHAHNSLHPYGVYFTGDAKDEAKIRLRQIIKNRNPEACIKSRSNFHHSELRWEPLDVLLSMINDPEVRTVGGVPQIMKIYQYGLHETFVWRSGSKDYFGGRELGDAERFDRRIASVTEGQVRLQYSDRSIAYESNR